MHVWGIYTCFDEKYSTCLHLVTWDHLPIWPPIVGVCIFCCLALFAAYDVSLATFEDIFVGILWKDVTSFIPRWTFVPVCCLQ